MNRIVKKPRSWDGRFAAILAHGAGQGIGSPFMSYFHEGLPSLNALSVQFNFDYMHKGRKVPDRMPALQSQYREVIDAVVAEYDPQCLIIGGKSMGGRVASHVGGHPRVSGLVFLGYPLHPPGKPDQLRDAHLYEIERPMLFVSGTRDSFATRELLERVVKKIGDRARLVWIEDGDHSLQVRRSGQQSWQRTLEEIGNWMTTIPARA